jgi:hypothetical protein
MSASELATQAMALPLADRVRLAQSLWQSIDADLAHAEDGDAIRESLERDRELSSGTVRARTHAEVMQAARRSIGCG